MLKARTPGLWMFDGDDEKQVLGARKHLLELLDDPYYFEAYNILLREKNPKLLGIKGRRAEEIGALACRLQKDRLEPDTKKRKSPGRPRNPLTANIELTRIGLEKRPGSLKSNCRALIKALFGKEGKDLESATDWLYAKVRSNKRNASST